MHSIVCVLVVYALSRLSPARTLLFILSGELTVVGLLSVLFVFPFSLATRLAGGVVVDTLSLLYTDEEDSKVFTL